MEKTEKKKNGLAKIAFVLSIIGICLSFIPILNNASFVLGVLAIIFAIVALAKKMSKGKAIAALVMGVLSVVITLSLQSSWSDAIDEATDDLNNATGNNTEEVLRNVDVNIGTFEVTTGEYGLTSTSLPVTVTNNSSETHSYRITIEAVDQNGNRIKQDYIYATSLTAGQSQTFEIFTYVSSDQLDAMQGAKFQVLEASMT